MSSPPDRTPGTDERGTGDVDALLEQLDTLAETVDDPEERREVRKSMRLASRIGTNGVVSRVITEFTRKDKAEAFIGSVLVGLPLLVEDGVLDIGAFLADRPAFFLANAGLTVALVVGILYVADFRDVRVSRPYFGVVPRRPVWVLGIAVATAGAMMTLWGRVSWEEPWLAVCQVSVIATGMAVGGSLGDILPGEHSRAETANATGEETATREA
ncbi:TIGR02587 family membrane protein [Halobacteria archaeon AArc-dxtr1]|nr:TIGR02587 family membrane protein [Halobacteria archaeon AArc-dxtr1]